MGRKPAIRRAPPPRKNILSNIKKAVSTVYKKTGLSKVVSTVGRKTGITNVVNSSKNAENLKKCNANLNNLRNKQTSLNQQYSALNNKQEQLKQDYNSKVNELKLKETQYNNLLNEYNIQVKDKQGLMDYLTVNEHFSNFTIFSNIEGLTSQEGNAVVKITNGLDYNFYNSIVNQNSQLDYETQKYKNIYSTDQQKSNYQSQQLDILNTWNSYLFIIYYVFVLILCYFLYYSKTLFIYMKVSILLSLLLYPFIINTIETNLYNAIRYTFAIINGNVYTN